MKFRVKYEDGPCASDCNEVVIYCDIDADHAKEIVQNLFPKAMITSVVEVANEVNETNKVKKMAKETKAERLLREENELQRHLAECKATYQPRLMALLERAQASNFEVAVKGMTFQVYDRDDRDQTTHAVDLEYSIDADNYSLSDMEQRVTWKEGAEREANRKFLATQVALAKLSKEEKELLGL